MNFLLTIILRASNLVSSTAVTAAMSNQAKRAPQLCNPCALATIIANATSFARVLVIVALLDQVLMKKLVWSIGTMMVVAILAVIFFWIRSKSVQAAQGNEASEEISLDNPFSLGPAIKFALFFVVILYVFRHPSLERIGGFLCGISAALFFWGLLLLEDGHWYEYLLRKTLSKRTDLPQ